MRGELSKKVLDEIADKIPQLDERFIEATSEDLVDLISDLNNDRKFHVAIVCFKDAYNRFAQTRMALHEAYACLKWYRDESPKAPSELQAKYLCKFYTDYAALLLYAIGEDIAAFIINFLDIEKELQDSKFVDIFKEKNIISNAAKVGVYLKEVQPDHEITKIILNLREDENWQKAIDYRNKWVHEKPPIIHGLGIEYNRSNRISVNEEGKKSFGIGGGSQADFEIDELLETVFLATKAVSSTLSIFIGNIIKHRQKIEKEVGLPAVDDQSNDKN